MNLRCRRGWREEACLERREGADHVGAPQLRRLTRGVGCLEVSWSDLGEVNLLQDMVE
jgi:hypothetical protein